MFHSLRKRRRAREHVEICIPAYRAELFIERTLRCALGQSHSNIDILVSVDQSEDATAEICSSLAKRETRIKLFVQEHRLGWAGNVNFLLDQVCAPFFFLYFHDDIIDSRYTELLLEALHDAGAASCHCDLGTFGETSHVLVGRDYLNSPVQRLATFLVAPKGGTPLRSLTRTKILDSKLRLPTDAIGGLGANKPYIMRLLASGPAVHVPQILYWRWNRREGGLTEGWKRLSFLERRSVFRDTIAAAIEVVDDFATTPSEREALICCLYVKMMVLVRQHELASGCSEFLAAEELSSEFVGKVRPNSFSELGSEIEKWALGRHKVLLQLEEQLRSERDRQDDAQEHP